MSDLDCFHDFEDVCDAMCFDPACWPKSLQLVHEAVTREYKTLFTRWDMPVDHISLIAIDAWKRGALPTLETIFLQQPKRSRRRLT